MTGEFDKVAETCPDYEVEPWSCRFVSVAGGAYRLLLHDMEREQSLPGEDRDMAVEIQFENAEKPGARISVEAHPQAAVTPGPTPDTAIINTPDGRRVCVVGDYRDVEVRLQAAAARAHESGDATRKNTPMS